MLITAPVAEEVGEVRVMIVLLWVEGVVEVERMGWEWQL
jgi:hypothetical protein